MAVKALAWIEVPAPESDGTYRISLKIYAGANYAEVLNDEYFTPSALATTVNGALRTFVETYIQSEWAVEFNPMMDSVKLMNPLGLL
jgi:hypothetical protein